jgi:hypothetical protein
VVGLIISILQIKETEVKEIRQFKVTQNSKLETLRSFLTATKTMKSRVPVAHTCNPSHSGGRDQEDCGSKPAHANSLQDPTLKKPIIKIWLVEWLKV